MSCFMNRSTGQPTVATYSVEPYSFLQVISENSDSAQLGQLFREIQARLYVFIFPKFAIMYFGTREM